MQPYFRILQIGAEARESCLVILIDKAIAFEILVS